VAFPWQQIQNQSGWIIWYYHLPPPALLFGKTLVRLFAHGGIWLAQLAEHATLDLEVKSSSPTMGKEMI